MTSRRMRAPSARDRPTSPAPCTRGAWSTSARNARAPARTRPRKPRDVVGITQRLREPDAHSPLDLLAEVGPPELPRLRGREPWSAERLDDFVREVPLIARKARRSLPAELRSDALVDAPRLRAVQLVRAPMQVSYLLEQRLKWFVVHQPAPQGHGGRSQCWEEPPRNGSARRSAGTFTQPNEARRLCSIRPAPICRRNLHSSAWWDRSLRWAAAGSRWRTTHRSTTSCSPARPRLVRGSASFRPPPATPTAGSPRSTRRSRSGIASRAACGSSARPSARSTISHRRT